MQLAAWRGEEGALISAIREVAGLALPDGAGGGIATETKAAFGFAPGKFLVADQDEGLAAAFAKAVAAVDRNRHRPFAWPDSDQDRRTEG